MEDEGEMGFQLLGEWMKVESRAELADQPVLLLTLDISPDWLSLHADWSVPAKVFGKYFAHHSCQREQY